MKIASAEVYMSKELSVLKSNITPIEALLLTAEHHQSYGKEPVIVDEKSVKDTGDKRTLDQEFERLRGIYGNQKVQTIMNSFKEFPDDFDKAIKAGLKVSLRKPGLSTISTTVLA